MDMYTLFSEKVGNISHEAFTPYRRGVIACRLAVAR